MTAPTRDVYLVAAEAAVAELHDRTPNHAEFIAARPWFRAALDAGEAFRHPVTSAEPIDPFQVRVMPKAVRS